MILDVNANVADLLVRGKEVLRNVERKRLDRLEIVLAGEHERHVLHRVCAAPRPRAQQANTNARRPALALTGRHDVAVVAVEERRLSVVTRNLITA